MLQDRFVEGMSHAASTVNVVTTDGVEGRAGVTVSAMCSVSADPPSLLVCVHHKSKTCAVIRDNGVLCVNVLRDDQAFVSDTFAGRIQMSGGDKFACAEWTSRVTGAPAMDDALVTFDCRVKRHFQWGSHFIFVAAVEHITVNDSGNPLIYANRAYGIPAPLRPFVADERAAGNAVRASETLRVGCFLSFAPFAMPRLHRDFGEQRGASDIRLFEGDQDQLLEGLAGDELDVALMYDIDLDPGSLETTLLTEIPPYVLLPAQHALAKRRALSLSDLASEPMVLLDVKPSRDYFTSIFSEVDLEPMIAFRSPSFETVRGMVANGLGYSVLVTRPANDQSYDGQALVSRSLTDAVTPGRIVIARLRGARSSTLVDAFVGHCKRYFSGLYH